MHLSEGILSLKQSVVTSSLAFPFVYNGFRKYQKSVKSMVLEEKKPLATMVFAACFAVTLLPIPVPIVGASSHMCATPLLAILFGPSMMAFPIFGVLLLHAIFFAHGGITTLGANILTLGVIGPWATWFIFSLLSRLKLKGEKSIGLACFLGSISVYFADTMILSWALADKQYFWKTFGSVCLGFLPVQGPLSILEAVLSSTILVYLAKYRYGFLNTSLFTLLQNKEQKTKFCSNAPVSLLLIFMFIGISHIAFGFEGIDDAVFTKTAELAGVESWSIIPQAQGELELFIFSVGFFVAGFFLGSSWEKVRFVWFKGESGRAS